jgi:biopolymer transport protein ExbD
VVSLFVNENGRDCARVDFGRGYIVPIDNAELAPIRVLASDFAAADSVEGQLRTEGKRWERTRDRIDVGSYVQDILQGRLDQPAGRGIIGKVASIYVDEQGRAVAKVDFGRGWVVGIFISELSPIRIIASAIPPAGAPPSAKEQSDPPSGAAVPALTSSAPPNRIRLDDTGHLFLNDESVPADKIREKLAALKAADPDTRIEVSASRTVPFRQVRTVMETLVQLDFTKVNLAVSPSAERNPGNEIQKSQAAPAVSPGTMAQQYSCLNNLRIIDSAKAQWALENHKQNSDTPTEQDLAPYIGAGTAHEFPICPEGGKYIIGSVGEKPRCSIPGHVLP